jgi:hypothetical protein
LLGSAILLLLSRNACALEWIHTNLQLLYGDGFVLNEQRRFTLTLEHTHGWRYGDNFFFVDLYNHLDHFGVNVEAYGEWYSTLSFNKMLGWQSPIPYVSDIALSGGINAGSRPQNNPFLAFLGGLRFTVDLPQFEYFQLYTHAYQTESQGHTGAQFTAVWSYPWEWSGWKFKCRGFIDITSPPYGGEWHVLTQPQLLLDVGAFVDQPDTWLIGVEWWYWHNKYGVRGANESVPQAALLWFF